LPAAWVAALERQIWLVTRAVSELWPVAPSKGSDVRLARLLSARVLWIVSIGWLASAGKVTITSTSSAPDGSFPGTASINDKAQVVFATVSNREQPFNLNSEVEAPFAVS